jgi:hypothetical protein
MLPLNLKDSKGNQVPVKRKKIWGHCTAVSQPGTKSISSQQCHMTQHSHHPFLRNKHLHAEHPGSLAGWSEVAICGHRTAGQPHTPGSRGPKSSKVGSGPTLLALADSGLSCTIPAACCKGLYPKSTDVQPYSQVSCF